MPQITSGGAGHLISNTAIWSPDGRWIVYDTRSDALGAVFDGTRIERVHVETGRIETLYESADGACCGVATYSPADDKIVFILGPANPTKDWQYSPYHRRGVIVETSRPGTTMNLDARELSPPFLPGALRGGTHLHLFSHDGRCVSFTYEDHILATSKDGEINQRNVGITVLGAPVHASRRHPRNHDGAGFSVLVTRTADAPAPGSDQISRAAEEAWVGIDGYLKPDGTRQKRAIAFQGEVVAETGDRIVEALIVDVPDDVTIAGDGPLEGTSRVRPQPPKGSVQRRLTRTASRKYPGLAGPRHWLRSNPDGSRIALLMRDDNGIVQLWSVSPNGGEPTQIAHSRWDIASAFTWSADGKRIAYVMDNSVFVTDAESGHSERRTPRSEDPLLPLACVFSPDGRRVAYLRSIQGQNQVFVAEL